MDRRIATITLDRVIPAVFETSEVTASEVWLRRVELRRPGSYLVEAASGMGKSSLCSFIYGVRRDYHGTISIDGRDIRSFSGGELAGLRRSHLAVVPQELRLFATLTAIENVMVKNRLTDRYDEATIRRMFDRLGIASRADTPVGRMSLGQQQRVAVIRALCQPFDFILLDEPVSHLDAASNAAVAALIGETARANDASVIITSIGNRLSLDTDTTIRL